MSYTKVNIRKDLIEKIKIRAAADNRSIANWIETILTKELEGSKSN